MDVEATRAHLIERRGVEAVLQRVAPSDGVESDVGHRRAFEHPRVDPVLELLDARRELGRLLAQAALEQIGRLDHVIVDAYKDQIVDLHAVPSTSPNVTPLLDYPSVDGVPGGGDGIDITRRRPFGANPNVGERGTDTQRRILAAGLEVFAEVGFDGARVELITEKAGCSRPAFYQYFSSKDDVFWKLAGRLGHVMVELGEQLPPVSRDADGVAVLANWIDAFVTLHETYSAVFASFQAASRDQPATGQSSVSISDQLGGAIMPRVRRGPEVA